MMLSKDPGDKRLIRMYKLSKSIQKIQGSGIPIFEKTEKLEKSQQSSKSLKSK